MRDDAGHHAVELEDCGNLDKKRGSAGGSRCLAGTRANTCNLDLVRPADKQCGVVLPLKRALEQVCAGTVCGAVDEGDATLRLGVVNLDALYNCSRSGESNTQEKSHTSSFAHATRLSRHRTCHIGPSPECRIVSL